MKVNFYSLRQAQGSRYCLHKTVFLLFLQIILIYAQEPITLQDGQYIQLSLSNEKDSYTLLFDFPQNPAQSSTKTNILSIIFYEDIPPDSSISLRISRDSNLIFNSENLQQSDSNMFEFKFQEIGGLITLMLVPNAALLQKNINCFVVFNTQPVFVKKQNFIDIGNFIYTKQYFSGTHSQLQLYNVYQIYIAQSGFLFVSKYDCIGQGELVITKAFNDNPRMNAEKYQDFVQPLPEESFKNYESRERIYQAEPGVYYIYILPTNGLSLQTGNVPKVYYSLQVQCFVKTPEFITMPARAMRNLDTLQIEGNPDNLEQLKATFYPLSAGLINDLDLNITYNMIIASDAIISNYYSKCGVNAPKLDDLDNPGNQGQSFQLRVIQTSSKSNQQLSYMINEINLKNSDLSIALEANILQQSYQGEVTAKVFYTSVSMKKRSGTQINSDIILIIIGGILLILSIPIGNFVRKLIKNRRKKGRIDQYGVTVPNKRDKEKLKPKDSLSLGKE